MKPDGAWSFDGEIRFFDIFDFNSAKRPSNAEAQVRFFVATTAGKPFVIESEWIRFYQTSNSGPHIGVGSAPVIQRKAGDSIRGPIRDDELAIPYDSGAEKQ